MRLKPVLIVVAAITVGTYGNLHSFAMGPTDCTDEKYLLDHGHSPEIIRMINLQKARTEGKVAAPIPENKFKKFFKNLWFAQDLTMPVNNFGYNPINTVETQHDLLPKDLTVPVNNYVIEPVKNYIENRDKDKADDKEIMINDVKIRDSK